MDRKKLLVVDDDMESGQLISREFALQYDVVTAKSGAEAIKLAVCNPPNCIVLELMMPQMGGFMLCEILKSLRQTKLIPIILMSNKPRCDFWPTVQKIGVSDYLQKPLHIEHVSDSLKRILETAASDRRKAPRVALKIPVLVRGKDSFGNQFGVPAETENVSRCGVLVRLPVRIPVGEQVEVHRSSMPTPNGFAILTPARVARHEEVDQNGPYWHGLEFLNPSPEWVAA